ncbi:MAG: hypothetical protein HS111_09960 [Kofleriaceae bacterium]|nr:hypothetical protein [Kofleriaceae bacterium]
MFTNEPTGPDTCLEHTIPRALCGRITSRTCSSDAFNNAGSPFDAEFAAAYALIVNVLAPLLSRQHQPGSLFVASADGGTKLQLDPGAVPTLRGVRVEARDPATNRPTAISAADPKQLHQRAQQLGWPQNSVRITTVPATTEAVLFRKAPVISPAIEVAVLKSALLTFDHLRDSSPDAFTRSGDLKDLREAIVGVIRDGEPADRLLSVHSWGMSTEDIPAIARIRSLYGPAQTSQFEHVLYVAGTKGGSLDLYFLVAGVDLHRFRLTDRWTGRSFAELVVAGMLADDVVFGPVEVLQHRHLGSRTLERAVVEAGMLETADGHALMSRVSAEVGRRRHLAARQAVSLVEQRADDFVREQLEELHAIDGTLDIAGAVRERLSRLWRMQREASDSQQRFDEIVAAGLAALPTEVSSQTFASADWTAWLSTHRAFARALEEALGLPSGFIEGEQHLGYGTRTPVR